MRRATGGKHVVDRGTQVVDGVGQMVVTDVGDQTYPVPAGTQLSGPVTVLVWCEAFDVEFVAATVTLR